MRRFVLLSVVILGLTSAGILQCQGLDHAHLRAVEFELAADTIAIPMNRVDGRIIVNVMIDGKGPFPFIFDTGAQGSVMDLGLAREQGLELGQAIRVASPGGAGRQGYQVTIGRLAIGGLTLKDMTSVAFEGMPLPTGTSGARGVIGPYSMNGLLITLDYPGQKVIFRRGSLPEPDSRELFGWSNAQRLPEIPATVAGQSIVVHLDSGASGSLSLPNDYAARLPLEGPLVDEGYAKTVDQVRPVRGGLLRGDLTLGRYSIEHPRIRFVDIGRTTGNVGAGVLSQFAVTIDPANRRLRLAGPADGKVQVREEKKPRYGMQLKSLDDSPLEVVVVDAGSPAEKAGLRAGDRVVKLNGAPVADLEVDRRLEALKAPSLKLTVRRGAETIEIDLALDK